LEACGSGTSSSGREGRNLLGSGGRKLGWGDPSRVRVGWDILLVLLVLLVLVAGKVDSFILYEEISSLNKDCGMDIVMLK
jgi:hypothetical protein